MTSAEDNKRIDELVLRYKGHDQDAALQLIDAFKAYTRKYIGLLKARVINYSDQDTRRFLALFTHDIEVRKLLKSKSTSYKINCMMREIVEQISLQLQYIPIEDLQQDMYRIILLQASRYQDKGKSFCFYLYNTFRYELKRTLDVYVGDPVNYTISYDEVENENFLTTDSLDVNLFVEYDENLDINWIQGSTCSDLFTDLSEMDRLILKMYYDLQYPDQKIADILGVHRNTARNRRQRAIKKVQANY
jgi:RNA polymerase sigma factor (sigma-70 family)